LAALLRLRRRRLLRLGLWGGRGVWGGGVGGLRGLGRRRRTVGGSRRGVGVIIGRHQGFRAWGFQSFRVLADCDDAARDNWLDLEVPRARYQPVALGAGIEPDLRNPFPGDLGNHLLADVGRHVERRHIDRPRHVEHRRIRRQSLDFLFARVDRDHRIALLPERTDGAVPELVAIARRADHGDDFRHHASIGPPESGHYARAVGPPRSYVASGFSRTMPSGSKIRGVRLQPDYAVAACGACFATNSSSRPLPSRRFSVEVAYEMRMKPGASNASPGVTATRASSSSASAKSSDVRK